MKEIVLAGLPNCGKSTLFSLLTGIHAVTGNREGVTVTAKSGKMMMKNREKVLLTDLPGIRRIPPRAPDEQLSVARLHDRSYDLLLYVTDVGNLANGLELLRDLLHCPAATCQACMSCEVECQVLLVVNFCDDLIRMGRRPRHTGFCQTAWNTPRKNWKKLCTNCAVFRFAVFPDEPKPASRSCARSSKKCWKIPNKSRPSAYARKNTELYQNQSALKCLPRIRLTAFCSPPFGGQSSLP